MRLPITIAVLAAICFAAIALWVVLSEPAPYRDTIRHIATSQPVETALESTAAASLPIELVDELGQRSGADWPCFLGPSGDGKSTAKGVKPWPSSGPPVVWTAVLGEGYAAPVVCRGRLLVFDRVKDQARCRCLHSENGSELWNFTYPTDYRDRQGWEGGARACPVTDGYRVYLHGVEGMLHCLRLVDGKLLWKMDTCGTFGIVQNLFGVASAPLIDGERLLLQIGGSPDGSSDRNFLKLEGNGSCIVALDKRTGQFLYKCGQDLASYASPQVVNLKGRRTGLMFARGGLLGFDPDEGVERFHYPFRSPSYNSVNASNAVIHEDQVFLTESYQVGCTLLDITDGIASPVWSAVPAQEESGLCCHWTTPILVDGHLYGCASRTRGDAELRCIELRTGKVKWIAKPTLDGKRAGRGSLAYADGHFFYLVEEGWVFLLKANPERYDEVSSWDGSQDRSSKGRALAMPCWAAPVLARGLLYVRGKGALLCLDVIPPSD